METWYSKTLGEAWIHLEACSFFWAHPPGAATYSKKKSVQFCLGNRCFGGILIKQLSVYIHYIYIYICENTIPFNMQLFEKKQM